MFDLKFFRRQNYFIKLLTMENKNPKILNTHQTVVERKSDYMSVGDMEKTETEEDRDLRNYVFEEVLPHFGLTYRSPSDKLRAKMRSQTTAKFYFDSKN
jgi:hypothetical protein